MNEHPGNHYFRYTRVMPRDLFNEGNLLTCYGKLALNIMDHHSLHLQYEGNQPFVTFQNPGDGSISVLNVLLYCKQTPIPLFRPLNARNTWPLEAFDSINKVDIDVFTPDGDFTEDFLTLVDILDELNPDWRRPEDALP